MNDSATMLAGALPAALLALVVQALFDAVERRWSATQLTRVSPFRGCALPLAVGVARRSRLRHRAVRARMRAANITGEGPAMNSAHRFRPVDDTADNRIDWIGALMVALIAHRGERDR